MDERFEHLCAVIDGGGSVRVGGEVVTDKETLAAKLGTTSAKQGMDTATDTPSGEAPPTGKKRGRKPKVAATTGEAGDGAASGEDAATGADDVDEEDASEDGEGGEAPAGSDVAATS